MPPFFLSIQEQYAIKLLDAEQCVRVYGFMLTAKRTLTWSDVLQHGPKIITLASCMAAGIPADKLHRMQPSIREWLDRGRATLADVHLMRQWRPNPFTDLRCGIADLVLHRSALPPQLLIDSGITFDLMQQRHGLVPELMALLKYPVDDWLALGVGPDFLSSLSDEHWNSIFGKAALRKDIVMRAARFTCPALPPSSS